MENDYSDGAQSAAGPLLSRVSGLGFGHTTRICLLNPCNTTCPCLHYSTTLLADKNPCLSRLS